MRKRTWEFERIVVGETSPLPPSSFFHQFPKNVCVSRRDKENVFIRVCSRFVKKFTGVTLLAFLKGVLYDSYP